MNRTTPPLSVPTQVSNSSASPHHLQTLAQTEMASDPHSTAALGYLSALVKAPVASPHPTSALQALVGAPQQTAQNTTDRLQQMPQQNGVANA